MAAATVAVAVVVGGTATVVDTKQPVVATGAATTIDESFFESLYPAVSGQTAYEQAMTASHAGRTNTDATTKTSDTASAASDKSTPASNDAAVAAEALQSSLSMFYGEFRLAAIQQIVAIIKKHVQPSAASGSGGGGLTVVDLGSGSGRTCCYLSVCYPELKRVWGIELVSTLHELALTARTNLIHQQQTKHSQLIPSLAPIDLTCGDFLQTDWWSTADIVVACSTVFDDKLMAGVVDRCRRLRVGAVVVTVSSPLPNQNVNQMFEVIWSGKLCVSWGGASGGDGLATVYIHIKRHNRQIENVILKSFLRKK